VETIFAATGGDRMEVLQASVGWV